MEEWVNRPTHAVSQNVKDYSMKSTLPTKRLTKYNVSVHYRLAQKHISVLNDA